MNHDVVLANQKAEAALTAVEQILRLLESLDRRVEILEARMQQIPKRPLKPKSRK